MQIQVNTNKIRTQYHKGGYELFSAAFIWSLRAQFEEKFNTPQNDKMADMGEYLSAAELQKEKLAPSMHNFWQILICDKAVYKIPTIRCIFGSLSVSL